MFPDKDAPSGLQMVLEISRVITQRCHAQGFMDILHVCEEDLVAARAQGAWCKREACLPAPLPLKACGNVPQCHSPFLSRASISIKENFTSILDHCCRTLSNLLVSVLSPQLAS